MLFFSQTVSKSQAFDTPQEGDSVSIIDFIPGKVVVGLATMPAIVGLWGMEVLGEALRELGELSEEVFRGERLPVLNFPQSKPTAGDSQQSSVNSHL